MKKLVILCSVILFIISGCKSTTDTKVVGATTYPISYIIDRIGAPYIHSYNLSESTNIQVAKMHRNYSSFLNENSTLFYISGLEPYFRIFEDELRDYNLNMIDLSSYGYTNDFKRFSVQSDGIFAQVIEEDYYDLDAFKGINMYSKDLFVWMDPLAMLSTAEEIRDNLIKIYPNYEEEFNQNYEQLAIDLTTLDATYQTLRDGYNTISFVSITSSFGNWQKTYGLNVYPVVLSKYGSLPNEQQLEVIKQKIVDDGVKYIAHEQNLSPEFEELYIQIRDELGLISVELSNISSLSKEETDHNKDYLTIMYDNFKILESMGN